MQPNITLMALWLKCFLKWVSSIECLHLTTNCIQNHPFFTFFFNFITFINNWSKLLWSWWKILLFEFIDVYWLHIVLLTCKKMSLPFAQNDPAIQTKILTFIHQVGAIISRMLQNLMKSMPTWKVLYGDSSQWHHK